MSSESYCEARDRDYSSIRKSAGLMITMAEDEDALKVKLREREARSEHPLHEVPRQATANLVGTTDQVAARIKEYTALGVDHFILRFHFGEEIEG